MSKLFRKRKLLIVLLSTISLCLFIFSTDPHQLSASYLLVPPALILLILFESTDLVLGTYSNMMPAKRHLISMISALGPVMLLLLASLGQLTYRDTVLSLLFIIGLTAYFSRLRPETSR